MDAANCWLCRHVSRDAVHNKTHCTNAPCVVRISILEYAKIAYYFYFNLLNVHQHCK